MALRLDRDELALDHLTAALSFENGQGALQVWLFGSVPIVRISGPEITRGELMRYLAELPWSPDSILHNRALCWTVVEDGVVQVQAGAGKATAAVRFHFDGQGDIAEMQADDRPSAEDGNIVLRRWRGVFSHYRNVGGRRIPARGEVGYVYDDGYAPYFRGVIDDLTFHGEVQAQ